MAKCREHFAPGGEKILAYISNFREVKRVADVVKTFALVEKSFLVASYLSEMDRRWYGLNGRLANYSLYKTFSEQAIIWAREAFPVDMV
jgi:hypothetical protein